MAPVALTRDQFVSLLMVGDAGRPQGGLVSVSVRIGAMIEAATVFLGLFSASIFLAHAIEAFYARRSVHR